MEQSENKNNDIFLKIEEIYQSKNKEGKETGKKFITHLLRSYFPQGKAQRVMDIPKNVMKCAITGQKLFAVGEIWEAAQKEEFMEDFKKSIMISIDPEKQGESEHPFAKVVKGRVVGLTGEKTDTYLSQEAYEGLFNWYATKILKGDPHINWLIKDMRKKSLINTVRERLPQAEDQKKIDRLEQISKHPQRATMSLGDLSVLKELQEKLKSQEENGTGN